MLPYLLGEDDFVTTKERYVRGVVYIQSLPLTSIGNLSASQPRLSKRDEGEWRGLQDEEQRFTPYVFRLSSDSTLRKYSSPTVWERETNDWSNHEGLD